MKLLLWWIKRQRPPRVLILEPEDFISLLNGEKGAVVLHTPEHAFRVILEY